MDTPLVTTDKKYFDFESVVPHRIPTYQNKSKYRAKIMFSFTQSESVKIHFQQLTNLGVGYDFTVSYKLNLRRVYRRNVWICILQFAYMLMH